MLRHDQKLFSSNLGILLKWSPFASEAELLKQVWNEYVFIFKIFNKLLNDSDNLAKRDELGKSYGELGAVTN
jgi:hypothetical protein